MANALTDLIMELRDEFSAGEKLGIDFEEKAFYDIVDKWRVITTNTARRSFATNAYLSVLYVYQIMNVLYIKQNLHF